MLRAEKYNLNALSHDTAISLVAKILAGGYSIDALFIDTVGDCRKYEQKLLQLFGAQIKTIRVEKKADSLFPIVSAASIVAKVTRDRLLRAWEFPEGRDHLSGPGLPLGSGYPADPTTKQWLEGNFDRLFGFPSLLRFSWATASTMLDAKGHRVCWREDVAECGRTPRLRQSGFLQRHGLRPAA